MTTTQNPVFILATSASPFGLTDIGSNAVPVLVDIDGDGDLDAFVGNSSGNLAFFRNDGSSDNAVFAASTVNLFGLVDIGDNASPFFADIDNDGDYDAFVGGKDGKVVFFENTGNSNNPAFAASSVNPFGLGDVGDNARPVFADIDNDGDLDIFIGNKIGNIVFYRNSGSAEDAAFVSSSNNPFGLSIIAGYVNPVLADIDGDGDLDLLAGNGTITVLGAELGGNTFLFRNTGSLTNPAFSSAENNPFGLSDVGNYASPIFADIDGDTDLDAFVGNKDGKIKFFLNKIPPGVVISATTGGNDIEEGGGSDTYTVVLKTRPTADVVITLNPNSQVALDKTTLTFTYQNWNVAQTVQITAYDDSVNEGDHNGAVNHVVSSDDPEYNNIATATLWVDVGDNDLPVKAMQFYASTSSSPWGLHLDSGENASPAFVDIDDDGDFDAFVGQKDGSTVFFRNTGDASTPAFLLEGVNPFGLVDVGDNARPSFSDVDNDGDFDIVFNYTLQYTNTGNASNPAFSPVSSTFASFGNAALDLIKGVVFPLIGGGVYTTPVFVDIDSDGDVDVLVGNAAGEVSLFKNTGSLLGIPLFASPITHPSGLSDVGNNAVPVFVDIDADGDLDAFVGNSDGDIKFFLNLIPGITITPQQNVDQLLENGGSVSYRVALDTRPTHDVTITLDDTNGQIALDKTTLTFTRANWNVAQTFTVTTVDDTVNEGQHMGVLNYSVSSADAAYDAMLAHPLVLAIVDNDNNTRDVTFALHSSTAPFGLDDVGKCAAPTFADIDADGDLDAFVGDASGNTLFFLNTGNASNPTFAATATNPFGLGNVGSNASPALVDIDGDGDLDAFIGQGTGGGNLLYCANTGNASSAAFAAASSGAFGLVDEGNSVSPVFADIDGDDDLDLLIGNADGNILLLANTGTVNQPAFAAASANPFGLGNVGNNATLTLADVDSDGDLDVLAGNEAGQWLYFANTGGVSTPAFAAAQTNPFGLSTVGTDARPVLVDIDADGDFDAFVGSENGQLRYFEGKNHLPTGHIQVLGSYQAGAYAWQAFASLQDEEGMGSLSYQWLLNGQDIVGATAQSLRLTNAEQARQLISVRVSYTDGFGTKESVTSSVTDLQLSGATQGGSGHDLLVGSKAANTFYGQAGNDWYWINHSGDSIRESVNAGRDGVMSLLQSYVLPGNVEDGRIALETGASLTGNTLANSLTGGAGADTLSGGLGADTFVLRAAQDSTTEAPDTIVDFKAAQGDKIDLSGIDANTQTARDEAFNASMLSAGQEFTAAGQLRLEVSGNNAILYGNTDADVEAEFAIQLMGVTQLQAANFVL